MITIFILASHHDKKHVLNFWSHLALVRRQIPGITWASPLYVEDLVNINAIIASMSDRYIVIGCLSSAFVAEILAEPTLREIVDGAMRKVPFVISPCQWDQRPFPFAGLMTLTQGIVSIAPEQARVFTEAARRVRDMLITLKEAP